MHASRPQGLPIDDYIAIASFVFFGVKAIIDAAQIDDDGAGIAEESEEASETLQKSGLYGRAAPAAPLAAPPPVALPPARGSVHGAGGVTHVVPLLLPTCESSFALLSPAASAGAGADGTSRFEWQPGPLGPFSSFSVERLTPRAGPSPRRKVRLAPCI